MNDRYIWNREARRLMTQESVLTAPIPLDEMSMKDLRNFSLHPYRFRANLLRGTIEISREREFELGGPSLRNSRCLPGGRYVVGLGKAEGSACELLCWDLKDTRTERVLNPVARFMLPSSNLNGCYFQFGVEHGHRSYITFSVLCSVGRLHTSWTHDVVRLECVQNSDGPVMRFVKVGGLTTSQIFGDKDQRTRYAGLGYFDGTYVVIPYWPRFVVWDCANDAWFSLDLDADVCLKSLFIPHAILTFSQRIISYGSLTMIYISSAGGSSADTTSLVVLEAHHSLSDSGTSSPNSLILIFKRKGDLSPG
ncbi:uncharacterized protein EI90DRAFT_1683257 [Cantharellus anzutake]|uniref:uncharacterized protein n=1 Tax=Cantharellus anzutake TaxID=1750568 RepID=UPI00190359D1|nr:uncharacterized protein EI90DRAFT_1683257 [Cantharellus anzutake]KAF8327787.1 hypothetical protein EI90DRAFT_1683257 [Cantharellus anzutake]